MKTATKTKKPTDEVEAKRRELRRLERLVKKAEIDLRIALDMKKDAKVGLCELAKLVKASPDCVGQVVRGALELCRKHYPKAYSANLYIHNPTNKEPGFSDHCTIPIPLPTLEPTADAEKGRGA